MKRGKRQSKLAVHDVPCLDATDARAADHARHFGKHRIKYASELLDALPRAHQIAMPLPRPGKFALDIWREIRRAGDDQPCIGRADACHIGGISVDEGGDRFTHGACPIPVLRPEVA